MEYEERAADPLAGGLMRGNQCGMVWGAALAAGARSYQIFGAGPQAEARTMIASRRMVEAFAAQNKHVNCREITGIDIAAPTPGAIGRFLLKSSITGSCFGMAARYAASALDQMERSFAEEDVETIAAPASCSAMVLRKMGALDLHVVMAAGFAGGIGLSGYACGALGAAIWSLGMDILKNNGTFGLRNPGIDAKIERFSEFTHNEFECAKIVGRKFENVWDHAGYLQGGGCSELIKVLTAS